MAHDNQMERSETWNVSTATSILSKSYAAMLAEIITKSNVGRQQFTREETQLAVGVFYEVLYGAVPEQRLNDCYLFVKRNRATTFALQPEELCAAWNEIKAAERYKNTSTKQLTHGFCEKCNNTGTEVIRQPGYTNARPCNHQ